jgi:VWFA-related protein
MKSLIRTFLLHLVLFILTTSSFMHAQYSNNQTGTFTINTDLVITWANITSLKDNSPIKGLNISDLLLREEGKQQQISLLKEGQPLSVVILVDGMTCVRLPEIEFQRSHEALRQLGEDAEVALMAWDSDVRLVQPLTMDQSVIANRLEDRTSFFNALNGAQNDIQIKVRPDRDHPRPGEAIYQAAQYLEKAASPDRRKIIIVITTSFSLMAKTHLHTGAEVKGLLKQTGATVYALLENNGRRSGYGSDEYNPVTMFQVMRNKKQQRSGGTLEEFVELTGGSILVSKNEAWRNLSTLTPNGEFGKEFDELFIKLARMIRSSYTIGYYPENPNFDGRFRRINVELSRSGKAKAGKADVKTRNGYLAIRRISPTTSEIRK